MMPQRESINLRRLNHLVGEDFYFLSYNIIVALEVICPRGAIFRDHRKLAHVIQFVSDARLLSILDRSKSKMIENAVDRELLFGAFTKAELVKREIYKLLLSLDRRAVISAVPATTPGSIDLSIRRDVARTLTADDIFSEEVENASRLRLLVPRLAVMTLDTFLDRVYVKRGVRAWAL